MSRGFLGIGVKCMVVTRPYISVECSKQLRGCCRYAAESAVEEMDQGDDESMLRLAMAMSLRESEQQVCSQHRLNMVRYVALSVVI